MEPLDPNDVDPAELARQIAAGNQNAEVVLVRRYGPPLKALLRSLTGNPALADDIHQDTVIIVINRLRDGSLREPAKLPAFINNTAKYLHLGVIKKEDRRKTDANDELLARIADCAGGPLDNISQYELRQAVRTLLEEMPMTPRYREVLHRFYIAEEDGNTICAKMNIKRKNFNNLISKARIRFRELVKAKVPNLEVPEF